MIPNRIVLDTNVCLDLFVFEDPRCKPLADALAQGRLQAVTRADCRTEWLLVLAYPQFGLEPERRTACTARFDALVACIDGPDDRSGHGVDAARAAAALPHCRDTDDQKFLEAARDSGATVLLTKDKALLKLAGRCRRAGLFDILQPAAWVAAHSAPATVE